MKFTVHQFNVKNHIVNGNFIDEKAERDYMDATILGKVDSVVFLTSYEAVCEIEAADLDEVFEIGNIGPESKIKRFGRMHSISVGDVIENDVHELFVVSDFGFKRLSEKEAA